MASIFEQWMFEAPGDDVPPDDPSVMGDTQGTADAPAVPDNPDATEPPDLSDATPDDNEGGLAGDIPGDDGPPDLGGEGDDLGEGLEDLDTGEGGGEQPMGLDDKVSDILNANLYQSYLSLLNHINAQVSSIKNNADILYSISADVEEIYNALRKLDENIRLYIDNNFLGERYEKNILFYNKCKNLVKLLDEKFDSVIKKGIKGEHLNN